MPRKLSARVREATTTTGTGDIVLDGAAAGHRPFNEDIADGDTVPYLIEMGNDFEFGIGTYRTTGPVIERTRIRQSSNSDVAVNWGAGTKEVWLYADPLDVVAPYERQDTATSNQGGDLTYFHGSGGHWTDLPIGQQNAHGFGNFPVASQAEAEAGTASNRSMTPLRTKQAIDALGGSSTFGYAQISGVSVFSLTTSTQTTVNFGAIDIDSTGSMAVVGADDKITAPADGTYLLLADVSLSCDSAVPAGTLVEISFQVGGMYQTYDARLSHSYTTSATYHLSLVELIELSADDIIRLQVKRSGSTGTVTGDSGKLIVRRVA